MDIVMESAFERIEELTKIKLQRNFKKLKMKFKATPGHEKPGVQVLYCAHMQLGVGHWAVHNDAI